MLTATTFISYLLHATKCAVPVRNLRMRADLTYVSTFH